MEVREQAMVLMFRRKTFQGEELANTKLFPPYSKKLHKTLE